MAVYLDYNATTPIDPRVLYVMIDVYRNSPGNADSRTHTYGDNARSITETARKQVADLLKAKSDEVFFTSGATESNNIAIQGLRDYAEKSGKRHIITTSIEHHAVLNTMKFMATQGFDVEFIDPDQTGRIDADVLLSKVRQDTLLVSVMHVNNETGIIQPVEKIGVELEKKGVLFHVDATQSCGKLVEELQNLKYDMLSLSAHKFRGPQGIGGLVLKKKKYRLPPVKGIIYGGQQEHGIRPGTTPVALVAGLGKACEIASQEYQIHDEHNKQIKTELLDILHNSGLKYDCNGDQNYCVNSSINLYLEGVSAEALMVATKQFCAVSNGSACTSKSYDPSYVLSAMGYTEERIMNSFRISWGSGSDTEEVKDEFTKLVEMAKKLSM